MNIFQRLLYTDRPPSPDRSLILSKGVNTPSILPLVAQIFGSNYGSFFNSRSELSFREAVNRGYNGQIWVRRCISARAEAVSSVPWKVGARQSDGTVKPIPNHPLELLLRKPNPYCDGSEFFKRWLTHLDLSGNAYWEKVFVKERSGSGSGKPVPKQLFAIRPDWVSVKPDERSYIREYIVDTKAEKPPIPLSPAEVLHFQYVDPLNEFVGCSPLTAARRTIETEDSAVRWNQTMLDNMAVPSGLLKVPAQSVVDEERGSLQTEIEAEFTGDNRHRPMILWGGMEWQQIALNQADVQFLEQRRLNKYEICAILGVPPPIIGANEDPTYSNYGTSRLSFWEDTIIPLLNWLQSKINAQLAIYWGEEIVAEYDISNVPAFREAFTQKVETAVKLFSMHVPLNAINKRLGLGFDSFPWGDVAWLNMNLVPVSSDEPPEPPEPETPPQGDATDTTTTEEPPDTTEEEDDSTEDPPPPKYVRRSRIPTLA